MPNDGLTANLRHDYDGMREIEQPHLSGPNSRDHL